ncbi:FeoA family protein [Thiomicrorhabdus sp. zzn3]|uniref:FeoA family protein n=1 Tax=Thiomicrorhabdus sp. zzn3 TaxID=3039775 RepID=UPI002436347D|nr:FeoA family protein [Thiomicrorhabdus sp. zzn3]MDG6777193.1 FeoA family protein [Thiomicrorhabdus sp. zzn3]
MPHRSDITLDLCHAGQTSEITALTGDLETKKRLVNLGFHTHSIVKLILVRGHNMVVCVDGTRFAIDKQIAQNIQVEVLS